MDNKKSQDLRKARRKTNDALNAARFAGLKMDKVGEGEISNKLFEIGDQLANLYDEISFLYKSE